MISPRCTVCDAANARMNRCAFLENQSAQDFAGKSFPNAAPANPGMNSAIEIRAVTLSSRCRVSKLIAPAFYPATSGALLNLCHPDPALFAAQLKQRAPEKGLGNDPVFCFSNDLMTR